MKPIDVAWDLLKALPGAELVQNRYLFAGQGVPFLNEVGNQRDMREQMRLGTMHPAIHPAKRHLIQSVGGRPTNVTGGSSLSPADPTDILRYPTGYNVTGSEKGRGDVERTNQQIENEQQQRSLVGNTGYLLDRHRQGLPTLSEDEMKNLRQQAQQMPFSYEGQ